MQKIAKRLGHLQGPQMIAHPDQLVVMNPDQIIRLGMLGHDLSETSVNIEINLPVIVRKTTEAEQIVKQRP